MTVLWRIALCLEKKEEKTEVRRLGLTEGTSFILEAAQQWVLTEVQEAGEQQQQVGGSGVHPEWWWFTAVRLKNRGPRRQRPEGRSEGQGRDIGRERWKAWRTNSWCFRLRWWSCQGGVPRLIIHTPCAACLTRKWLLLPQESSIYHVFISVRERRKFSEKSPENLLSSPSAWIQFFLHNSRIYS